MHLKSQHSFLGSIFCIHFINHIFYWHHDAVSIFFPATVKFIINRNEPDIQTWKNCFYIIACFYKVSSKAGQILYDNALNLSCPHIFHHSDKSWSVKICSCITIIYISIYQMIFSMFFNILMKHLYLCLYRFFIVFFYGKSGIDTCLQLWSCYDFRCHHLLLLFNNIIISSALSCHLMPPQTILQVTFLSIPDF